MPRPTRTVTAWSASLAVAATLLLGACGGGGGGDDEDDAGAKTPVTGDAVTIRGFAFGPEALQVQKGTKVTWTNKDSSTHTATADDGSFDTKSIKKGAAGTATLEKAGTFAYHCDIHPSMHGSIVVR